MKLRETIANYAPCCEQEREEKRMMIDCLDNRKDVLERKDELCHFSASAWVVNPERTKVLMLYHNIYKSWSWPGGHADGEEDLLAVAMREVQEETGLQNVRPVTEDVFSLEILTVNPHFKRGKYVLPHLHLNLTYLLEADEEQEIHSKPDENSGVKWFKLEDAVAASSEEDMRVVYAKLNEKLKDI